MHIAQKRVQVASFLLVADADSDILVQLFQKRFAIFFAVESFKEE